MTFFEGLSLQTEAFFAVLHISITVCMQRKYIFLLVKVGDALTVHEYIDMLIKQSAKDCSSGRFQWKHSPILPMYVDLLSHHLSCSSSSNSF